MNSSWARRNQLFLVFGVILVVLYGFHVATEYFGSDLIQLKDTKRSVKRVAPQQSNGVSADVKVYNLTGHINDVFECVTLRTKPAVPICIYNQLDLLSREYKRNGIWERHLLLMMQAYLRNEPGIGLIDVGANVGYYSLIAAKMGNKVLAVEPVTSNVRRIHKATVMAKTNSMVTLIQNGIANKHEIIPLDLVPTNIGGSSMQGAKARCARKLTCLQIQTVFLDDLAPFANFTKAIMKIDIEGFEQRAFARAAVLFSKVDIPVVFMEMLNNRVYCGGKETEDRQMMRDMLKFFADRKYIAYQPTVRATHNRHSRTHLLDPANCHSWPGDVIWVRKDYPYPPKKKSMG